MSKLFLITINVLKRYILSKMYCNFLIMTDHAYLVARVCARATGSTAGQCGRQPAATAILHGLAARASQPRGGTRRDRLYRQPAKEKATASGYGHLTRSRRTSEPAARVERVFCSIAAGCTRPALPPASRGREGQRIANSTTDAAGTKLSPPSRRIRTPSFRSSL